jgi:hypothetical protein
MLWRIALVALALQPCFAESVTGILYHESGGQGREPAGNVTLFANGRTYDFDGSALVIRSVRSKSSTCQEPGAMWTMEFSRTRNKRDELLWMNQIHCTGGVDPFIHEAWKLARNHLRQRNGQTCLFVREVVPQKSVRFEAGIDCQLQEGYGLPFEDFELSILVTKSGSKFVVAEVKRSATR